jgi:Skp family chaperone for outer membrane proteins
MKKKALFKRIFGYGVLGILLLLAGLLSISLPGEAKRNADVGYIDMEHLQQALPQFVEAQQFYREMETELRSFAQYKETEFRNMMARWEREKEQELKGKEGKEREEIEQKYVSKVEQEITRVEKEIEKKRQELLSRAYQRMDETRQWLEEIVEAVADEEGVSLVLEKGAVFYGGIDLTEKVLQAAEE